MPFDCYFSSVVKRAYANKRQYVNDIVQVESVDQRKRAFQSLDFAGKRRKRRTGRRLYIVKGNPSGSGFKRPRVIWSTANESLRHKQAQERDSGFLRVFGPSEGV